MQKGRPTSQWPFLNRELGRREEMIKSHPKLSPEEFQQAKGWCLFFFFAFLCVAVTVSLAAEAFMLYDTSGDEKLELKEVGQLLRALGMTPTHLQVRDIVREHDKDKNGVLDFGEFLELYAKHKQPAAAAKELLEAFKVFDKKGTGTIAAADLSEALTTLGDPLPQVQVKELVAALDTKGTGQISIDDFVAFLTRS